jgi:integrase
MDRLDREKKKLESKLVAKAAEAEKADTTTGGKKRKRQSKPKKRSWKEGRPAIPYEGYPLSPHASGKWVKKINGVPRYFGRWAKVIKGKLERIEGDGWKEALDLYKAQADDLHAGRTPRASNDGLTVKMLCDHFYSAKKRALEAKELSPRTLNEYDNTCERIVATFGRDRRIDDLRPDDFAKLRAKVAETWGPVRLGNEIQRIRTVFKYGFESGHFDTPVRFGPEFKKPSKAVLRKHKATGGSKVFTADEVRRLKDAAGTTLKAMILLGINCAFGNTDVGTLPKSTVDLKSGWVDFPRPKTGINRRCPLWPETVKAIKAALEVRPDPKSTEHSDLLFITKHGHPWAQGDQWNAVTIEFGKVLRELKINGRRNLGFYSLRHTFRTVADAAKDQVAINFVMGHADQTIADHYRHGIDDSRLKAVTDHVHQWLFLPKSNGGKKGGAK